MAQPKPRKTEHLPPLKQMRRERSIGPALVGQRNPSATGLLVGHGDLDREIRQRKMIEDFIRENAARIRSELEAHRLEMMGTPATPAEIRTLRRALGWDY